jgi:hypothetical protein
MQTIKIYGASDDLIEVEGGADGCDEFNGEEGVIVLQPTGDRFRVKYGVDNRAVWDVTHEHVSGQLQVSIEEAPEGDDPDPYTDTAVVTGDIQLVRFWENWPPTIGEIRERVEKALEDPRHLSNDVIKRVWEALGSP